MKTPVPPPSVKLFDAFFRKHTLHDITQQFVHPGHSSRPSVEQTSTTGTNISQGYEAFHFCWNVLYFKLLPPSRFFGSFACFAGLPLLRRAGTSL